MNLDFTVNYERTFSYTFDPANSNGTENDLVNVINFPFIIFSTVASRRGNLGNEAVNKLVSDGEKLIKRKVKVGDILFRGIDVSKYSRYLDMLDDGHDDSLLKEEFRSGTYGIFKTKIGANEGNFTVESGLKDTSTFGQIKKWKNARTVNFWYGDTCNMINGTDGSVFPANVGKSSKLEIFDIDLCRSIDFLYNQTSSFHSVPALRFALDKDLLADPRRDPSKVCFCKNAEPRVDNCLKRGVLDVSSCRDGAPYIMSYPHFLDASPEYGQPFGGLQPDPKLHSTTIEVQPRIGVITKYTRRFQWNIRLQPLLNIDYFSDVRTLIFPIAWNDDVFTLDADKVDLLVSELANQDGYGRSSNFKLFPPVLIFCGLVLFFIRL